jgi:UDP-N-acetylmuramoyl-tripeptide--D-alanyl-D-alanine ligase
MRLTLAEIVGWSQATLVGGDQETLVQGATVDSRAVPEGALFVGLEGENADGGLYAPAALESGAAAALIGRSAWRQIEDDVDGRWPIIVADDPLHSIQQVGRRALARSGARVAAITGSTGKTTTKDVLVSMLRAAGARAEGTPGNMNTEIGVPIAILGLDDDVEVAVVEMGMRGVGQIAELAALAPPDVACITGVGPAHLELLGTVENVAAAKSELIGALRAGGTAVIPEDEPLLEPHVARLAPGVSVRRFGDEPAIDVDLRLEKAWQRRNAAAAVEVCLALGLSPDPAIPVAPELSAMRGQEYPLDGGGILIEDCYNANPVSMRAALEDLARRPGRRVAILGDMMELGPEEARYHREIGEAVDGMGIEVLITVGERARSYGQVASRAAAASYENAEAAAADVPDALRPGDVVLLKASRAVALEQVAAAIRGARCPES